MNDELEEKRVKQVAAGERCLECGQWLYKAEFGRAAPRKCYACGKLADSDDEAVHESRLRCPHCRCIFEAIHDSDDLDRCAEGEHSVYCPACERDFTIYTAVRFSYRSPKMEKTNA